MKLLLATFLIASTFGAHANEKAIKYLVKNKLYYSAFNQLVKTKSTFKSINRKDRLMNAIVNNVHVSLIAEDPRIDQFRSIPSELDFFHAIRSMNQGDLRTARKFLNRVDRLSLYDAQAHFMLGLLDYQKNKYMKALLHFKRCVKSSGRHKDEVMRRSLKNRCVRQASRVHYSVKHYKKTLGYLDYVRKNDYLWPRTLLDRAWSSYWLGDYGKALGTLVSFRSPVLKRYMTPEIQYLRAFIYFQLCYYNKARKLYKQFEREMGIAERSLKKFLKNPDVVAVYKNPKKEDFIVQFFRAYKKDFKYTNYRHKQNLLNAEKKKLISLYKKSKSRGSSKMGALIKESYNRLKGGWKVFNSYFTKYHVSTVRKFLRELHLARRNMVKLKLILSTKKRKIIRKSQEVKDRKKNRLSLYDIDGTDDKAIYEFLGGFWADELGDYTYAIETGCGSKK